jgi:hypothetical protein
VYTTAVGLLMDALGDMKEFDFVQHYYGLTNQTRDRNECRLRLEVVERVVRAQGFRPKAV